MPNFLPQFPKPGHHRPPKHDVEAKISLLFDIIAQLLQYQHTILKGLTHIMATQKQAAEQLGQIQKSLGKISGETQSLLDKVAALQTAADEAGQKVGPELQAAIDAVAEQAQKVDDMVPDSATNPTNDAGSGAPVDPDAPTDGNDAGSAGASSPALSNPTGLKGR